MANDKHFVPGSFYRICDRTGFKVRSFDSNKEWTGLIVRNKSWEPRQPQDFVRGVRDDQTVPDPRPRQQNVFVVGSGAAQFIAYQSSVTGLLSFRVQLNAGGQSSIYVYDLNPPDPQDFPVGA